MPNLCDLRQSLGHQNVVGVDRYDDIARGAADALVESIADALVALGDDNVDAVTISVHNVQCAVSGETIYDDVLAVGIILVDNAPDGPLNGGCTIVADGYDGYLGLTH